MNKTINLFLKFTDPQLFLIFILIIFSNIFADIYILIYLL